MSLRDDLERYFAGTWVGFMVNGVSTPMYVQGMDRPRGVSSDDYSLDAMDQHKFIGYRVQPDGTRVECNGTIRRGNINIEMKELGYVVDGNQPLWLSWRPNRSTKKGLCCRRTHGLPANMNSGDFISDSIAASIFEMWNTTNAVERQFHKSEGGILLYKGHEIGTHDNEGFTVKPDYRYLRKAIELGFGNTLRFAVGPEEAQGA